MKAGWDYTELDRKVAVELQDFLPDRIFDAHAHLWKAADIKGAGTLWTEGPPKATVDVWRKFMGNKFLKSTLVGGLFAPSINASLSSEASGFDSANDFISGQMKEASESRGLLLVGPLYSSKKVARYLECPQIIGFKPYHLFGTHRPTWESPLGTYLPEWVWETAHERKLVIMLHMVKDKALADPDNQRDIREMCLKYPSAKLLLAHAARGLHPQNTIKGLPALRGLENVWFDTSAICESAAILAILREFGPRRVMWGSDFPVSEIRGKSVSIGDGFAWLQWDTLTWDSSQVRARPVLAGLESLRALKEAACEFGLNKDDLADVFCDNALRFTGLKKDSSDLTAELYRHAKQRIPGGTQLLSKRPEMFAPEQWPAYFREARGCETWDLDGKHYYDMSTNSVGACLLGYRDPDVTRAVQRRINLGSMCSLNPPDEVELADLLCEIHPWAQQVRFARGGGEAVAVAVRIARATTDRSVIAVCGYHGWHDWYLAANLGENDALRGHLLPGLNPLGVPAELRGSAVAFNYNDRDAFRSIMDKYGDRLAAVVMEPCRQTMPEPGFLEFVKTSANSRGALLVFDEITIGWRLCYGGVHLKLGVNPDIAVFAKALGNGHPVGAVIGTARAMEGANSSFISSTYWTDGVGPAAALATLRKMGEIDVPGHAARIGSSVQEHWRTLAEKHNLPVTFNNFPCLAHFRFNHEKADELRTLYTQLMLKRGFLAGPGFYVTLAHTDEIVARYAQSIDVVFGLIAETIKRGDIEKTLAGPVAHAGFRRLI
ncbi:MAG: aminotransferase class III-fold pyridoxal phosphate-dependent enzyme [Candidatus Omnitrophica bacterium]|nr:aminotransferase class III-fold pyridoxal phosphate-dependent enzyme [Candidatus Omnitrophota bacterium]